MKVRQTKQERRLARLRLRSLRYRTIVVADALALSLPLFLAHPAPAFAQNTSVIATPTFLDKLGNQQGAANASTKPGDKPGQPFYEILRGNGTRAGYILSHGNILPGTVSLSAGGRVLRAQKDYYLDPDNGTLYFAEAVRSFDTISACYRYLDGDSARQPLSIPGLSLAFGKASTLSMVYGMTSGSGTGVDVSTYGLGLSSKFGAGGLSSYNGLFYFSNAQKSSNVVVPTQALATKPTDIPKPTLGADHLIVQSLAMQSGGLNAHFQYQDVGKDFAGFQTLKLNSAGNKALTDQLTALEGEKGVRRLGLGLGSNFGTKKQPTGGLSLDWNQIQDGKGAINQQIAELKTGGLHLNYSARQVSDTFEKFQGLREADKAQWALEKGMKSTNFGVGLNFGDGKKKGSLPGALDFQSQEFSDKSGSLRREAWNLNAGSLGVSMLSRRSDKAFTRLNNLSAADKTAMALDLYHQYDPTAQAAKVTANDLAQVGKEAGLSRDSMRLSMGFGKNGGFAYSQSGVQDLVTADSKTSKAAFTREAIALQTGNLSLDLVNRRTDTAFSRIADLADVEKTYLALDIRRQFDPNATPDQVAQKERDQAVKEAGLQRSALRGRLKLGKGGKKGELLLNQFGIASLAPDKDNPNAKHAIQRQTLAFANSALQFSLLDQSISNGFLRLGDLSDFEKAQFANERGLKRQQRSLTWQVNKATKIAITTLRIGGTNDAIHEAVRAAQQDGKDPAAAGRAVGSGVSQEHLAFETKGFSLTANAANTDKEFARSADLALTDPERQLIERERGFRRSDYTTHFAPLKGLTIDSTAYKATNSLDDLSRNTYKHNLQFSPNKLLTLSYVSDGDITRSNKLANGLAHALLTLNKDFGKGTTFNFYRDEHAVYDKGVTTAQTTKTEFMRFQTAQDKPNAFSYENKQIDFQDGKYENTSNLNFRARPTKSFTLSYSRLDIDRDQKDPSESTDKLDIQWQTAKNFSIVAGFSQRDTTDKTDANSVTLGLQGQPIKDITLAAKYDEVHQVSKNTKGVADISICNAKPFKFGPITDFTLTARYASLNDQRKLQNETMTGKLTFKMWKNDFLLDYGGFTMPNGTSTVTRVYSFITDPNPKKWFHGTFLYKSRTMIDGQERLVRRFTADARLSKRTNLLYTFGTLPEDDKGNPIPLTTADVSLKHAFRPNQSLSLFYRLSDNQTTKVLTRSLGFSWESKLSSNSKMELGYSADANGMADKYSRTHHYRLAFDQQFNADHFLTLSTDIRSNSGKGLVDEIQTNLEFRRRF